MYDRVTQQRFRVVRRYACTTGEIVYEDVLEDGDHLDALINNGPDIRALASVSVTKELRVKDPIPLDMIEAAETPPSLAAARY